MKKKQKPKMEVKTKYEKKSQRIISQILQRKKNENLNAELRPKQEETKKNHEESSRNQGKREDGEA